MAQVIQLGSECDKCKCRYVNEEMRCVSCLIDELSPKPLADEDDAARMARLEVYLKSLPARLEEMVFGPLESLIKDGIVPTCDPAEEFLRTGPDGQRVRSRGSQWVAPTGDDHEKAP